MFKYRITVVTGLGFLSLLIALLATTVVGSTAFRGKAVHAASANKCGQWSIIPSGKPDSQHILSDVAVISANDVWTVGFGLSNQGYSRTLAEHWNGKAWKVVATPNRGPLGNYLRGVVAFASNNVWAVGYYQSKSGALQTLIEHSDGTAWNIVASPNVGKADNLLFHMAAVSPNDIWAVGYSSISQQSLVTSTLVEHWDGTAWKVVPSPNVKNLINSLSSVAVVSKNDVWAVGQAVNSTVGQTLIEHWNGTNWQIVASPNPNAGNSLLGIAVVSANDIWAVGNTNGNNKFGNTLTEHWNGTTWKVVASPTPMSPLKPHAIPNFGAFTNTLYSLAVITTNNIWAVGDTSKGGFDQTMIEHWDGKQWSIVASPNLGPANSDLFSAARVGNTSRVWAVGYTSNGTGTSSGGLTEFYC